MTTENSTPDRKWFLAVTAVFGLAGLAASGYALANGELELRLRSRQSLASDERVVAGRLDTEDIVFYPLAITGLVLSIAMLGFPAAALFSEEERFVKFSSWSLAGFFVLVIVTVVLAKLGAP